MELKTHNITRFSQQLIHFYFVPPTTQLWVVPTDESQLSPEQGAETPAVRPSRLMQRWTRNPDGTLAACWKA
jgi:hypothetical protein